jgi:hypothetical protein
MQTYTLKFPVTAPNGRTFTQAAFNRLTRNDQKAAYRAAGGDRVREEEILIAKMTGLPIEVLDDLDAADNTYIMDRFEEMTGATSSGAVDAQAAYCLRFPFEAPDGTKVDRALVNRLKRGDFKVAAQFAPGDVLAQEDFLLAKMTGINPDDIGQLDATDNAEVMRRFRYVLGRGGNVEGGGQAAAAGAQDSAERDRPAESGRLLDVGGDGAGRSEGAGEAQ